MGGPRVSATGGGRFRLECHRHPNPKRARPPDLLIVAKNTPPFRPFWSGPEGGRLCLPPEVTLEIVFTRPAWVQEEAVVGSFRHRAEVAAYEAQVQEEAVAAHHSQVPPEAVAAHYSQVPLEAVAARHSQVQTEAACEAGVWAVVACDGDVYQEEVVAAPVRAREEKPAIGPAEVRAEEVWAVPPGAEPKLRQPGPNSGRHSELQRRLAIFLCSYLTPRKFEM